MGVEYFSRTKNKIKWTNVQFFLVEKKVEMGGRSRFPAFLFHSHWARESESRIPSQAGTKLASGAHPNNYTAPL